MIDEQSLIGEFEEFNKKAMRLAEIVSIAARVEPELLRKARLTLVPQANAGDEADLWFSPLVQSSNSLGFVFYPEIARALREKLATQPDLLDEAWHKVIKEVHANISPALFAEEKLTWLALKNPENEEIKREIEKILREVFVAVIKDSNNDMAFWALRAWQNLPPAIREFEEAKMMRDGARLRLGRPVFFSGGDGYTPIPEKMQFLLSNLEQIKIGVRFIPGGIEFGDLSSMEEAKELSLPGTNPLRVDVSGDNFKSGIESVSFQPGEFVSLNVIANEVELRTVSGERYRLRKIILENDVIKDFEKKNIPGKIFISYSRADEPFVKQLYQDLEERGFDIQWDRKAMESRGLTFQQEIRDAIEGSDIMIVVISPNMVKSEYVRVEWEHGFLFAKCIIPILRTGDFDQIPQELSKLYCPDFRKDRPYKDALDDLLRSLKEPAPPSGIFHTSVPSLPPHFQPRRDELTHIGELVLADIQRHTVKISSDQTTAIVGSGGSGKSVLAAAFARATDTRRAFTDGLFWLQIGPNPDILSGMRLIGMGFNDDPGNYVDIERAKMSLLKVLEKKVCLIVLDDVWNAAHAAPFINALGPRCRLLITTRDSGLVMALGAQEFRTGMHSELSLVKLINSAVKNPNTFKSEDKYEFIEEAKRTLKELLHWHEMMDRSAKTAASTESDLKNGLIVQRFFLFEERMFKDFMDNVIDLNEEKLIDRIRFNLWKTILLEADTECREQKHDFSANYFSPYYTLHRQEIFNKTFESHKTLLITLKILIADHEDLLPFSTKEEIEKIIEKLELNKEKSTPEESFILRTTTYFRKKKQKEFWRKLPQYKDSKLYDVRAIVDSEIPGALEKVDRVEYFLPGYPEPNRNPEPIKDHKNKFLLKELAFGRSTFYAKVFLKGKKEPIELEKFISLEDNGPRFLRGYIVQSESDLRYADLSKTDNLIGADMKRVDLSGANLNKSDLSGADLTEANLSNAKLNEAMLVDSITEGVIVSPGTETKNIILVNPEDKENKVKIRDALNKVGKELRKKIIEDNSDLAIHLSGDNDIMKIVGTVRDATNENPLSDAEMEFYIDEDKLVEKMYSDDGGIIEYKTTNNYIGKNLIYKVKKDGFVSQENSKFIDEEEIHLDIELVPNEKVFPEGRLTREDVEHAIREKISLAKRDMSYANLKGLDFSDMDLTEADFSNATLTDTKIINTNLTKADFSHATLTDTILINTNLTGANLSSAELSGANLSNSKLSGAKLYHTNLDHSTLNEANLTKLDFSNVKSIKGADFSKAVLTKATLSNVDLSGAILKKANLSNANLSGAILIKANLSNANLSGANMRKINLSGAILNEADLTETDLSNANLSGAKLIKAYLARANLSKADLKETDLSNAKLMGAVLDRANIKGAIMSGVEVDDETSTKGINLMGKWKFHSDNTEMKKALLEIDKELRKIICRDNKNDDDYRQICSDISNT